MCRQSSQAYLDDPTRRGIATSKCAWLQARNPYQGAQACLTQQSKQARQLQQTDN